MFKLTEEEILRIINLYGGSKKKINLIEAKLNIIGIVSNEEDYYELICDIIFQMEFIKQNNMLDKRPAKKLDLNNIICNVLRKKYNSFENNTLEEKIKLKNILCIK